MKNLSRRFCVVLAVLLLCGCVDIGPRMVEAGRLDYNLVLQQSEDQQLLLNLVRLRYRDRPYFLETTSLATQFSVQPGLGAIAAFGSPSIEQDVLTSGSVTVEAQPTVTYTPLQGEDFFKRMLTPIQLQTVVLLANSGWSIDRILRLTVQRMNGLPNAPSAAGPTPTTAPEYRKFAEASGLLRTLQVRNELAMGYGESAELYLLVSSAGRASAEFQRLTELLSLDPQAPRYRLNSSQGGSDRQTLRLQLRSLSGVLYYASQAVEPPAADLAAGRVTTTRQEDGQTFDWQQVTAGLFRVRAAADEPDNAAAAVRYRNAWFYVDDSDLTSKSTFTFIGQLFSLQAESGDGDSPLLTLPLG